MIVYRLHCSNGHRFEGWFASGDAFTSQRNGGMVACPTCDDREVEKLPSAPYVNTGIDKPAAEVALPARDAKEMAASNLLAAVREFLVANTEDVGRQFPEVARRIHYGEEERRGIRGRATRAEAEELVDEGVQVLEVPAGMVPGDEVH